MDMIGSDVMFFLGFGYRVGCTGLEVERAAT